MSAHQNLRPMREVARPMVASTFAVWRVLDNGKAQREPVGSETLEGIQREIATEAAFGSLIMVHERETLSGRTILRGYRIKKKAAAGWANGRKVYPHFADEQFALEVSAFAPVEPWRWSPGADVIGATGILEGARS